MKTPKPQPITYTVTISPEVSKGTATFRMLSLTKRPLPDGAPAEIRKAIGVGRATFDRAIRLRRIFDANPGQWKEMEQRVFWGSLHPKRALAIIAEAEQKNGIVPTRRHRRNARRVYLFVSAIREPAPHGTLAAAQRGLGVGKSAIMDALKLCRMLREDKALREKWQAKAITGRLSSRAILKRIAAEKQP